MAAYAVVVSVMHLMEHTEKYHARRQFLLEEQQCLLESLHQKFSFLEDFLARYSLGGSTNAGDLEKRLMSTAFVVEDVIESYILENVHDWPPSPEKRSSAAFSRQGMQKVIDDLKFLEGELKNIKDEEECVSSEPLDDPASIPSLVRPTPTRKDIVVLFDDQWKRIKDTLTGHQLSENTNIISVTGMGGIGKTTLAKQVYEDRLVMEKFDVCGWVTIPQDNNQTRILSALVHETGALTDESKLKRLDYNKLGDLLHRHLYGKKYLIVLDDVWKIDTWEKIKRFLPEKVGSGILVTSRIFDVAKAICPANCLYKMNELGDEKSWSLLCREVFGEESDCPGKLVNLGKTIARNCKGLPLSIVVIAGLLGKHKEQESYWDYVAENTGKSVNSTDDDRCLKILYLSYSNLPAHIKPCFLYMGVYPEDHPIRINQLIKLWVAEGFLKPNETKSLDEVARYYLDDLIDRNLISVSTFGCTGKRKSCKIHDLVRDMCLKEALSDKFLCVTELDNPEIPKSVHNPRRVAIHTSIPQNENIIGRAFDDSLQHYSQPFPRSLTCHFELDSMPSLNLRFLRVLNVIDEISPKDAFHLVNSRYLHFGANVSMFPSSIDGLWDLQTLIVRNKSMGIAPSTIWKMPQLMHLIIEAGFFLPDPPSRKVDGQDDLPLEKLETLVKVLDLMLTEEVLKRIPHVRKMKLLYLNRKEIEFCCLNNLGRLKNLYSLECEFPSNTVELDIDFPQSLTTLILVRCHMDSDDMKAKIIGSLPNLEKLKLRFCFMGEEWCVDEDEQFVSLKYLEISDSCLKYWIAEDKHFPVLEHLVLASMENMEELPDNFQYVNTLKSVRLTNCTTQAADWAKAMLEENKELCVYFNHELISVGTSLE